MDPEETTTEPQQPPMEKAPDAKKVLELADKAFADNAYERRQYWLTQAFLEGEQWVNYDARNDRLTHNSLGTLEDGRPYPQVTQNVMGPAKRAIAARLLNPVPWEVPSRTPDPASAQASRIAEAILSEVSLRQDWPAIDMHCFDEVAAGGFGAVLVGWDRQAGTPLGVDTRTGQHFGTGDVTLTVLGVDDIAFEPGAHDARTARWMIVRRALPPGQVQEMFGLDKEPPADAAPAGMVWSPTRRATNTLAKVLWLYHRPTGTNPGYEVVVVDNKVVVSTEWSYPFTDHLPIGAWIDIPVRRRAYGRSWMWWARSLQMELNQTRSHVLANLQRFGNIQLIVDESFGDEWDDMPGVRRVALDPLQPREPRYLAPPALPGYVQAHAADVTSQINEALGTSELLMGNNPTGVTSASALSVLIEQQDNTLKGLNQGRRRMWEQVGTMVLELYRAYVREERDLDRKVMPGRQRWTGNDLLNHTTVKLPEDRMIPKNKAADRAHAEFLVQNGLLKDIREYASFLDIGPDDEMLTNLDPDRARAERENHDIAAGLAAVVEAWDDDRKHIDCHTAFAKGPVWDVISEEARQLLREHLAGHQNAAAEKAGKMISERKMGPELAVAPEVMKHDSAVETVSGEQMRNEMMQPNMPSPSAQPAQMAPPPMPDPAAMPPGEMPPMPPGDLPPEMLQGM